MWLVPVFRGEGEGIRGNAKSVRMVAGNADGHPSFRLFTQLDRVFIIIFIQNVVQTLLNRFNSVSTR
ncbi:hypothetical protein BV61_01600 [Candidatus Synechococcus spongiarum LMB bulk15M]|uniref:Uncharacterized protein n=1 Tax=Candidatus Synechococcus spongiarum LMB bulk15M TaxID=1943582 RepID=A0A1T1D2B3_9SYNE|nr:hypothetical protein BV61_01600 [Candidatus Synechococcus spongiarum LMB bulk15M]